MNRRERECCNESLYLFRWIWTNNCVSRWPTSDWKKQRRYHARKWKKEFFPTNPTSTPFKPIGKEKDEALRTVIFCNLFVNLHKQTKSRVVVAVCTQYKIVDGDGRLLIIGDNLYEVQSNMCAREGESERNDFRHRRESVVLNWYRTQNKIKEKHPRTTSRKTTICRMRTAALCECHMKQKRADEKTKFSFSFYTTSSPLSLSLSARCFILLIKLRRFRLFFK